MTIQKIHPDFLQELPIDLLSPNNNIDTRINQIAHKSLILKSVMKISPKIAIYQVEDLLEIKNMS
jgi:hypothetical protein